ncbi:MAG: tetratricopeptide repeat protein [Granulosicoccus sp.]
MSPSIVRRERLAGPLALALLAGAFVLAFFWLRPASVPGSSVIDWLNSTELSDDAGLQLDELDLAYIKAKKASGDISDGDVVKVVLALLRVGRSDEARQMLAQYPALEIEEESRTLIDLELAAAESPSNLATALRGVVQDNHRHDTAVLERALLLSERLQQSVLTFDLFGLMAVRNDVQNHAVYLRCGNFMADRGMPVQAVHCYQNAIASAPHGSDVFDTKLMLLSQLLHDSGEQQVLIDSLQNRRDLSVDQLQRLAPALLAVERPDVAYRIYARLALMDDGDSKQWLQDASTWAQAANKPADAAVFLDALAKQSQGEERKRYLQEIISVLVAAGQSQNAFNRVHEQLTAQLTLTQTADNQPLLDQELARGVDLARQLGKTRKALDWNTQRLVFDPDSEELLALQSELALAVADLPLALETARERVRISPLDPKAREQLARVNEWNNRPIEASQQWLWLSNRDNQQDEPLRQQALNEVVRLSTATFQSARAAKALRELTLLTKPSDEQVLQLVTFYELEGLPAKAAVALNDIMLVHGQSPFLQRTLAMHNYKHERYADSLNAWELYSHVYGNSSESAVYRMELLWRMDRPEDAAEIASGLRGSTLLSHASDYQLRLIAEIAWRYDMPWLAKLVQPRIQTLEELDMRALYGRRSLESLEAQGQDSVALQEAMNLWQGTGQIYFALSAMQLALKRGDEDIFETFDPASRASSSLLVEPGYWLNIASMRLRNGDGAGARTAYEQALKLDEQNIDSIVGLLWLDIAEATPSQLQATLQKHKITAETEPRLWQAMAVGYLELGAASTSVIWFEKLLDQIDTDYGMLLTYADALEYAGRAADARRVREYTVFQLRPLLAEGAAGEQSLLLRQYAQLAARYSGANHNEALINRLMNEVESGVLLDAQDIVWREDLSISWLMSTQRHEQARVVMTNLHSQRIQAPLWQRLALALNDKDKQAVEAILQSNGPLSIGNHILALRQLGNDRQAYAMAQRALQPDALNSRASPADMQLIAQQYASLRNALPSYVSGSLQTREVDGVSTTERGVSIRHSLIQYPLGFGLELSQRTLSTGGFSYDNDEELGEVALSLFFGNRFRGGRVTAGMLSEDERVYANAAWFMRSQNERRLYSAELGYREELADSAELYLGARRNRASAAMDASLGKLPFLRLQADATQINTRTTGERFADGLGGQAELGVRGKFASSSWSASVQAGQLRYERSDTLPEELALGDDSTVDSVLQAQAQRLSVGASLSSGQVNGGFPQVNKPRYFLDARLGQSWPSKELGMSLGGGGGIRVLGGDELSFSFRHDAQGVSRSKGSFTSFGVGYRYHF